MGTQLPSLHDDGSVTFSSAEDFDATWSTFIARGALPVRPERSLAPLESLDITLHAPGLTTTLQLKVEVVQLTAERALLRLMEAAPDKPTLQAPPASERVMEPEPAKSAAAPPIAELKAPHADEMPPPWMSSDRVQSAATRTQETSIVGLDQIPELDVAQSDTAESATVSAEAIPRSAMNIELEPLSESKPVAPVVELEPCPAADVPAADPVAVVAVDAEHGATAPSPPPMAPPNATVSPPATVAPTSPLPAAPAPTPPPQAPAIATMPPWFTGDALRFQSNDDFKAARENLLGVGAVLTIVDGKIPHNVIDVKLAVASKETRARAKVSLSGAAPGTAVVQATEKNGFKALVEELEHVTGVFERPSFAAPLPSASATSGVPTAVPDVAAPADRTPGPGIPGPRAFTMPRQGNITNPTTPAGILAMPLARAPTDADLEQPSMPLLLRWLRTTRGTLKLEATSPDHPVFSAVFVDGREVRTPASIATLGRSLAMPKMSYTIVELGRPPQMTTSSRTLHLIGEVVRALTLAVPIDDLARAFPAKAGLCARAITDVLNGFGLPSQHSRFVKSDVDGTRFIEEIARAAVGGRTVWETMYLLEVYNGLAWDQPPENKKPSTGTVKRTTTGLFERPSFSPSADEEWAPFEGKDHFQVLGLHWSSSPTEVGPAYQKLRAEYGTGGIKRPASKDTAEKILKRLEEAFKVLNDATTRRAYRREKYNLVWAHQAQLLVQKAKLALYRKDYIETQNILLAAEDMSPSEEAKAMLNAIRQKTNQQS